MTEDAHAQANAEQVQLLREALEVPEEPQDEPPADLLPEDSSEGGLTW
ncbi:hypothetical protein [Deinococcus aestuarii]|nr:hypothetical protein [Deinococcus aestuarii]